MDSLKPKRNLVFSSPPYFNVERYSYDDTQSWVRYKTIDDWNTNFLHKTIANVWPTIRKGGYLAVNIADVYATSKGDGKGYQEIFSNSNITPKKDNVDASKDLKGKKKFFNK